MSYEYQGDVAGSRSMNVKVTKINDIDAGGLWVTILDEEDMECELILEGLTPGMMRAFMEKWGI